MSAWLKAWWRRHVIDADPYAPGFADAPIPPDPDPVVQHYLETGTALDVPVRRSVFADATWFEDGDEVSAPASSGGTLAIAAGWDIDRGWFIGEVYDAIERYRAGQDITAGAPREWI